MARIPAILKALGRAEGRNQKSIWSVTGNNFLIVSVLIMQDAGAFIYLIIGLVILFPLSADPLRKIPQSRLHLFPLTRCDRLFLRAASVWLNPISWAIAALAIWVARGKVTLGLWSLSAGLAIAGFALSSLPAESGSLIFRKIPAFRGSLNQLIRKNLREALSTLDFYCALLLSASVLAFRVFVSPLPGEALVIVTVLIVLALSTYAQCLFGLDGESGLSRYRLFPLRGWQILAAKNAAFLCLAVPLALPGAPLAGAGAALVALAIGNQKSVRTPHSQARWRFSTRTMDLSHAFLALLEAAALFLAAASIFNGSSAFIVLCLLVWAGSLWWSGKPTPLGV